MTDKGMMVLQSCTNSENLLAGAYGETYPTCHDANQTMNVKPEEVIDTEKEEDPLPITLQEIKAKTEVSFMSLCVHCKTGITNMQKCQLSLWSASVWMCT
jgi:hypothetical protein